VFKLAFRAGLAEQMLGDVEPSCGLRRRKQVIVATLIEDSFIAADHRLTKILVLACIFLHRWHWIVRQSVERFRRVDAL